MLPVVMYDVRREQNARGWVVRSVVPDNDVRRVQRSRKSQRIVRCKTYGMARNVRPGGRVLYFFVVNVLTGERPGCRAGGIACWGRLVCSEYCCDVRES
jgi:hypothetical protein